MKLSCFSRMKAYRRNGRLSFILRLSLPQTSGQEVFNSFYITLAQRYVEALDLYRGGGDEVFRITVSFADITEEYVSAHPKILKRCKSPIVILRTVKSDLEKKVKCAEYVDIYDTARGVFIK